MTQRDPLFRRDAPVLFEVSRYERSHGPMHESHHWHATAWVDGRKVCDCWCFTRAVAIEEAMSALSRSGVEGFDV